MKPAAINEPSVQDQNLDPRQSTACCLPTAAQMVFWDPWATLKEKSLTNKSAFSVPGSPGELQFCTEIAQPSQMASGHLAILFYQIFFKLNFILRVLGCCALCVFEGRNGSPPHTHNSYFNQMCFAAISKCQSGRSDGKAGCISLSCISNGDSLDFPSSNRKGKCVQEFCTLLGLNGLWSTPFGVPGTQWKELSSGS